MEELVGSGRTWSMGIKKRGIAERKPIEAGIASCELLASDNVWLIVRMSVSGTWAYVILYHIIDTISQRRSEMIRDQFGETNQHTPRARCLSDSVTWWLVGLGLMIDD